MSDELPPQMITPTPRIVERAPAPTPPAMTYVDGRELEAKLTDALGALAHETMIAGVYSVETFRHELAIALGRRALANGFDPGAAPKTEQLAEAEALGRAEGTARERERLGREVASIGVVLHALVAVPPGTAAVNMRVVVYRHATDDHPRIKVRDENGKTYELAPADLCATWWVARTATLKLGAGRGSVTMPPRPRARPTADVGRRAKPKTKPRPRTRAR